jgi:cytochrome c-type biogenesis protein
VTPGDIVSGGALWLALPLAMLAGLVSFLSPCVLPLVPGYLGFIAGAVAPRAVAAPASTTAPATTTAPVSASAPAILQAPQAAGPAAQVRETPTRGRLLVGQFFLEFADAITRVMGVVIIVLGLVFIGLFGFAQRTFKPQVRGNLGLVGAPLLGLALGIGWAPCIGPTLAAILAISWNSGDPVRAGLLGLAYSLGLGIPFVLLTLGFGWATRSVTFLRRHIRTVNIIGGLLLVVLGVLMASGLWTLIMTQLQGVMLNVPLPV